ncbi:hypothetical protein [Peribacillus kribbensis]|uniref:hypothetical protein n=1 Tax=Peribacillus kribbensis TaxID=356658 RepID=UPI0004252A45|nr:hypothetical protein [Peribacillus kribbensis]
MEELMKWMINSFGYEHAVEILDLNTFLAGLLAGILLTAIFLSKVFLSAERRADLPHVSVARIRTDSGREQVYFNPATVAEALKFLFVFISWKLGFFNSKHIFFKNAKLTKRIWAGTICTAIIIVIIGLILSFTVPRRNDIIAKNQGTELSGAN